MVYTTMNQWCPSFLEGTVLNPAHVKTNRWKLPPRIPELGPLQPLSHCTDNFNLKQDEARSTRITPQCSLLLHAMQRCLSSGVRITIVGSAEGIDEGDRRKKKDAVTGRARVKITNYGQRRSQRWCSYRSCITARCIIIIVG